MGQFTIAAMRFIRWRNAKKRRRPKRSYVYADPRFHNGGHVEVDTYIKESVRPNQFTRFSFGPRNGDDD